MKLISMTDFVLDQDTSQPSARRLSEIIGYAEFLKQPLRLEMFVPCDEKGNVLINQGLIPSYELGRYRKAKEKVLFKGFSFVKKLDDYCGNLFYRLEQNDEILNINFSHYSSIEKLIELDNIELTENALKQIGI